MPQKRQKRQKWEPPPCSHYAWVSVVVDSRFECCSHCGATRYRDSVKRAEYERQVQVTLCAARPLHQLCLFGDD